MDLLRELAELTTLDEQSPQSFRVRAYENAMRAIEGLREDPATLSEAQLTKIAGIGKSTAKKIREYLDGGRVAKLDELRAKFPPAIVALSQLPGIGPKAVAKLRSELGIENLDDLRRAIAEQRIRALPGMGAKTETKLASAIERLGLGKGERRAPIAKALPLAERLVTTLAALPAVVQARYCGSLRRMCETIGDIDIVVASSEPLLVMEALVALPQVDRVIARGDTKTSVVTRHGLQVDVRVVEPEAFGAATLYFTGSKAHNIRLRQRAIERGLLLNEYGLYRAEGGELVTRESEEAIYAALGLPWIPEPLREDSGEIEAAEAGTLPRVMAPSDILGDLHVHTTLSGDGRTALEDMIAAARGRGYRYLAITEHAENLPLQGVKRQALDEQRVRFAEFSRDNPDFALLHGCELNIGPDGTLDYDEEFRLRFDWCLASVHTHFELDREEQTRRILRAMDDPSVNMIGHLSARTIGKRPGIDLDIDAVLAAAARTGTAIEINSGLPRLDAAAPVLRRARDYDVVFVLTSDAHHEAELDRVRHGVQHALRGWVDPARVANTWPKERFLSWVAEKRARATAPRNDQHST
jgi:DNA polymerase (family 10)